MRLAGGCGSAADGDAEPRLCERITASHRDVSQRAADEGVGAPGCH